MWRSFLFTFSFFYNHTSHYRIYISENYPIYFRRTSDYRTDTIEHYPIYLSGVGIILFDYSSSIQVECSKRILNENRKNTVIVHR